MDIQPPSTYDGKVDCPKCGTLMLELDQGSMTDGQQAEYKLGNNIPLECPECGHHDLFFVESPFYEDDFEFQYDDRINEETFEDLIDRAIDKRCFIEVIALIHNVIELYLKYHLRLYLFKIDGLHNTGYDESRIEKDDMGNEIIKFEGEETDNEKKAKKKFKMIFGKDKWKNFSYYQELCLLLNLIDENLYNDIYRFNRERNTVIHKLLKEVRPNGDEKYTSIIEIAKRGRRIQLKLSPLNHSDDHIKNILKRFSLSEKEKEKDPFLRKNK